MRHKNVCSVAATEWIWVVNPRYTFFFLVMYPKRRPDVAQASLNSPLTRHSWPMHVGAIHRARVRLPVH